MKILLMRKFVITYILGAGALLAACGSTPEASNQVVAPEASAVIAEATAAPTPAVVPTPTIASTQIPMPTVAPTQTTSPTPMPSMASHDHTLMPEASAAPQALPAGAEVQADIKLFQYKPEPLEVAIGTTVVWTNEDDIEHSVTHGTPETLGGAFDSGLFGQGKTFSFTFTEAGGYLYFCTRHNSMQGRVNVTAASAATTNGGAVTQRETIPPDRLVIAAIDLDVSPVPVGLDEQRIPVVPRHDVGWFTGGAQPGQGSNVIFWGHVLRWKNTPATPAPFERLHELQPGAEITVFSNRQPLRYQVTEQIQVRPENVAYLLPTAEEQLTFVSCIGDNVIVTGTLTKEFRLVTIAKPLT